MKRTADTPIATLTDLRRVTPWLWVYCERCQHRSPAAIVPLMIRWGADASSDMLRQSARCTQCGGRGATIQLPGWGGQQMPVPEWPESHSPPLGRSGSARLICSELAVRLVQSLQALRPCRQSEGCLQGLIESVPALRLCQRGIGCAR